MYFPNYRRSLLTALALILFVSTLTLNAQVTTATIYGVVRDLTGAVLPGAAVVATNRGTNLSRDTITDERGEFALPALQITGECIVVVYLQPARSSIQKESVVALDWSTFAIDPVRQMDFRQSLSTGSVDARAFQRLSHQRNCAGHRPA